ncbi:MAG: alcohol dehydrogenase catalytic domain-containing protein [Hyphomicrobiales bacterium]|nr:alcohol dehydrogenase catalytic domain-containing protein [Hyphomicrobiales bacterium]MBV8427917.1 alcohol dehydrogenase catalytic domain-containing protein [Hyphomicrobiales bacterium]
MKALVYTAPHQIAFRDEPDPAPSNDAVVVKVEAVGICGSDMHAYHGQDTRRPAPLILGHEAAGTVASGPRAGERVAINPLIVDPECPYFLRGAPHLSPSRQLVSMPTWPGAFAEFVRVPVSNLVAIPEQMSTVHAALAEPVAVSYHAVNQGARLLTRPLSASRCVVLGAGAIGVAAALVLAMQGALDIFVGEPNALRRATAARSGPFICYAPEDASGPAENSVDLVIDAVGAVATRAAASRMIAPGGVIVHAGLLPGHEGLDIRKLTLQEVTFTGTYCYTPTDFREAVAALAGGRLGDVTWLEERPLSEGPRAFADIDANAVAAAKIILRP